MSGAFTTLLSNCRSVCCPSLTALGEASRPALIPRGQAQKILKPTAAVSLVIGKSGAHVRKVFSQRMPNLPKSLAYTPPHLLQKRAGNNYNNNNNKNVRPSTEYCAPRISASSAHNLPLNNNDTKSPLRNYADQNLLVENPKRDRIIYEEKFAANDHPMKKKSKNITESLEKNEFWYHSNHHKIISHFDAKLDKLKGLASEKEKIVRQLQGLLRNNMDTSIKIYTFGSSYTGLDISQSDLDIVMTQPKFAIDHETKNNAGGKRKNANIIVKVRKILEKNSKSGRFHLKRFRTRLTAKIPVLMFECQIKGIGTLKIDLSCSETLDGVRNSHYLLTLSKMDYRFKYLAFMVKSWSKNCGINDAPKQFLSSYTLTLLLIYYLQSIEQPAVIPNMIQTHPNLFNKHTKIDDMYSNRNENFIQYKSESTKSITELFVGFINYYSMFQWDQHTPSLSTGKLLNRASHIPIAKPNSYKNNVFITIEDPLTLENASSFCVSGAAFTKIKQTFNSAKATLLKNLKKAPANYPPGIYHDCENDLIRLAKA